MKTGFYKTCGDMDIVTEYTGNIICIKKGRGVSMFLNREHVIFLKKCIDEILEDENYD